MARQTLCISGRHPFDIPVTTKQAIGGKIFGSEFPHQESTMKLPSRFFLLGTLLLAASAFSVSQTSYSITDLGALSSNGYSVARSVNLTAAVTGAAGANNTNASQVFLY